MSHIFPINHHISIITRGYLPIWEPKYHSHISTTFSAPILHQGAHASSRGRSAVPSEPQSPNKTQGQGPRKVQKAKFTNKGMVLTDKIVEI